METFDPTRAFGNTAIPRAGVWTPDILGDGFEAMALQLLPDEEGEVVATLVRHTPAADPVMRALNPGLHDAGSQAGPGLRDAHAQADPGLHDASSQAGPGLRDAHAQASPALQAGQPEADPAALVLKNLPAHRGKPLFNALYIHGWNDYFFNREMARAIALMGGQFYALDLRKYGRSWRKNQTFGWITSLRTYDEDISEALSVIGTDLPVVMMAHSTGGLTASLWAHRNPGALAALWLNSPWLDLQTSPFMRSATQQLVEIMASRDPRWVINTGGNNFYGESLQGWQKRDGALPQMYQQWANDPAIRGWSILPEWKSDNRQTLAGWLAAIGEGHQRVAKGLDITCPILTLASASSYDREEWSADVRFADAVLNVRDIVERAARLGEWITIRRYRGVHDLTLSLPDTREALWRDTQKWLNYIGVANPSH
ncbi:alpha/beta hydrolase [Gleimia hominis]|uniref:Alpha/beta hydrolase n=1 Tax=Gleimia hominis TaxID=595468 RepID=A0ABU3I9J3_9ACTO|nr:alpha/beta hydrolase [Gleimia hominis]MDT3767041.1 alpha/beta hydrolase [Gleimia hominis]